MCLEDLRLGRGRYNGRTVAATTNTNSMLQPNRNRVALIVSVSALTLYAADGTLVSFDFVDVFFAPNNTGLTHVLFSSPGGVYVWRVEDLGLAVMGSISVKVGNFSGVASITITEVLTDENSEAIGFHSVPPKGA